METPLPYIVSVLTIIFAPLITFIVAKTNNKRDLTLDDRQAFRNEQERFQKQVYATLESYKKDNEKLKLKQEELENQLRSVRLENVLLQQENISLTATVTRLEQEILHMEERLSSYENV